MPAFAISSTSTFPDKTNQKSNTGDKRRHNVVSVRFARLHSGSLSKQKIQKFRTAFGPGANDDHHPAKGKGRPSNASRPVRTI